MTSLPTIGLGDISISLANPSHAVVFHPRPFVIIYHLARDAACKFPRSTRTGTVAPSFWKDTFLFVGVDNFARKSMRNGDMEMRFSDGRQSRSSLKRRNMFTCLFPLRGTDRKGHARRWPVFRWSARRAWKEGKNFVSPRIFFPSSLVYGILLSFSPQGYEIWYRCSSYTPLG